MPVAGNGAADGAIIHHRPTTSGVDAGVVTGDRGAHRVIDVAAGLQDYPLSRESLASLDCTGIDDAAAGIEYDSRPDSAAAFDQAGSSVGEKRVPATVRNVTLSVRETGHFAANGA